MKTIADGQPPVKRATPKLGEIAARPASHVRPAKLCSSLFVGTGHR